MFKTIIVESIAILVVVVSSYFYEVATLPYIVQPNPVNINQNWEKNQYFAKAMHYHGVLTVDYDYELSEYGFFRNGKWCRLFETEGIRGGTRVARWEGR